MGVLVIHIPIRKHACIVCVPATIGEDIAHICADALVFGAGFLFGAGRPCRKVAIALGAELVFEGIYFVINE